MSTARAGIHGLGYAGLIMRAGEFEAIGETAERYELVNGVVLMSPSPRPRHWKIIEEVLLQLREHGRRAAGPGKPPAIDTYAETDLFIDDLTVFRPDLCAYARARGDAVPERLDAAPDLVLEVLSPGGKPLDLVTKREAYERFGVREYWTIDSEDGRVRAWSLREGRYRDHQPEGDSLRSAAIPGFVLDLAPIRALIENR